MTPQIDLMSAADAPRWDAYVAGSSRATLFHTTGWKRVVEETYGHPGLYLWARSGGRVCGILPVFLCGSRVTGRALIALPFCATQPSVCADDEKTERALIDAALGLAETHDAGYVELREQDEKPWGWSVKRTYANLRLPLVPDPETVWRTRAESRVRTKVREAIRNGLCVRWGGPDDLNDFYALYTHTMHRLGSPPHAKALFLNILNVFPEHTEIALVLHGERPVAGAFVMHDRGWIGFPWAASLAEAHPLRPNNLLYWSIIERACREGFLGLDLGRSPIGSGTMHFKRQWGATVHPLAYYYGLVDGHHLPGRDASDPMMVRASRVWRWLPARAAAWLGPRLARLIP
ncbi:MAG: FemAB family PEP-CTERM system-associated protein [Candidatus Latescibacteria bacterium]|nr:FemAB family PEP-CTERM system-associated protein [Candidatus Latescibacterota bacterium]